MDSTATDPAAEYQRGHLRKALRLATDHGDGSPEALLLEASIRFDLGDAVVALDRFKLLLAGLPVESTRTRYQVELARFVRFAPFFSPATTASMLAGLRQLATSLSNYEALGGLHVAVAKLEALRGAIASAASHVAIAERLSVAQPESDPSRAVSLVKVFVDSGAGNFKTIIDEGNLELERARAHGVSKVLASVLANAGQLALWTGEANISRRFLLEARNAGDEFAFLQLGTCDTLAALEIYCGNLDAAAAHIKDCQAQIARHRVPARSWYDLTHDLTRCLYHGQRHEWADVVAIVAAAEPELNRRHLRTWQASLLAAGARAHARLGDHDAADAALLAAMRACPRGAIDPMIAVEMATGTCLTLRGDTRQGQRHFDRALRAAEAIEHRFQTWMVEQERASLPQLTTTSATSAERRPSHDTGDLSLLLADLAGLVGSGHSVELLARHLVAILDATSLRSRVQVSEHPGRDDDGPPSAHWELRGSHGCRFELADTDRTIRIELASLASLEEIALVKRLTDILATTVPQNDEADQQLWPQADFVGPDDVICWSPRMQELLRIACRLASTNLPILLTGETGTGKEVFARVIHDRSRAKRGPFVPFNASAIPRELVESQLFGHRRGAFTGALDASPGVIRGADKGTLFLDEIGDLDPLVQPKLLRFLESDEIHAVGEIKPQIVSARVVAATNARLETLVEEGRFRSDLLYRLRVASLDLPPLRERKDEIPALTAHFVRKAAAECGRNRIQVGDDVLAALLLYDWPGNLRQLNNELRRMVALADDGATLRSEHLSADISTPWVQSRPQPQRDTSPAFTVQLDRPLELAVVDLERAFIEHALTQTQGRVTEAAQLLGISRKGLFLKRKKLGLYCPD